MAYNPPIGSIYHLYTTYSPCLLGGLPSKISRWISVQAKAESLSPVLKEAKRMEERAEEAAVEVGTFFLLRNLATLMWLITMVIVGTSPKWGCGTPKKNGRTSWRK